MSIRNGINVSRTIGNGFGRNISEELHQVRTGGSFSILHRCVVEEVFYNPAELTNSDLDKLADIVANPEAVANIPRNSILGRVISHANDLGDPRSRIIYPFFQSHLQLPLTAGEQVWIIYPDPTLDVHQQGYWLTRIHENSAVEDLNYTHADRRFDQTLNPDNQSTSNRALNANNVPVPSFPNGGQTIESFSLFVSGTNENPFHKILNGSRANKNVTFEAVPRFFKRPNETAILGKNNSRIVLGEDRVGQATRITGSAQTDKIEKSGMIDLVAGYGSVRFMPATENDDPTQQQNKRPTAPHVIVNGQPIQKPEVNKTPFLKNKTDNKNEGDIDFKRDLSRIYLAMKTAGDKNFEIKKNKLVADGKLITNIVDLPDGPNDGQPFMVAKSEHIRIIATGKDKENNGGPTQSGDIRIIKEGTETGDKDLGLFMMSDSGEIIQVGKNIQLLTHDKGKLFLQTKTENEPYILMSEFKKVVDGLHSQIDDLKASIQSICQAIQTAAPASICVPYSPDSAFSILSTQVGTIPTQLNTNLTQHKQNTDKAKDNSASKKVFGA